MFRKRLQLNLRLFVENGKTQVGEFGLAAWSEEISGLIYSKGSQKICAKCAASGFGCPSRKPVRGVVGAAVEEKNMGHIIMGALGKVCKQILREPVPPHSERRDESRLPRDPSVP
jgi:hypothetical protein